MKELGFQKMASAVSIELAMQIIFWKNGTGSDRASNT